MKQLAILTPKSKFANLVNKGMDKYSAALDSDKINPKIERFWAKVQGILGTVGVLALVSVVLGWAGVDTSVNQLKDVIGASDAVVDAIILLISALDLLIVQASAAFQSKE